MHNPFLQIDREREREREMAPIFSFIKLFFFPRSLFYYKIILEYGLFDRENLICERMDF